MHVDIYAHTYNHVDTHTYTIIRVFAYSWGQDWKVGSRMWREKSKLSYFTLYFMGCLDYFSPRLAIRQTLLLKIEILL